jgi:hypothetical protein
MTRIAAVIAGTLSSHGETNVMTHGPWQHEGVTRLVGWSFLAATALLGCSSAAGPSSDPPATSCGITVMSTSCALTGCHLSMPGSPAQANLDLSVSALGDGHQLVNVPAQGSYCGHGATPLPVIIDPNHPERSLLYNKLQAQPVCGPEMPYGRPALSPDNQQCILDWIATVPGVTGMK